MARIPVQGGRAYGNRMKEQQQRYLKAEAILRYLLQTDDAIDTMIKCNPGEVQLVTTDQSMYEALGSIKDYDDISLRNLIKFLEVVDIVSFREKMGKQRKILTESRVEELRKSALSSQDPVAGPTHDTKKKEEARG